MNAASGSKIEQRSAVCSQNRSVPILLKNEERLVFAGKTWKGYLEDFLPVLHLSRHPFGNGLQGERCKSIGIL